MNFLSHLYLSGNSDELKIGNFIADSVKGSDYKMFNTGIQEGIVLHRKIDAFTDTHEIVEKSKARLRNAYRKYASVIVDIYYDHFLAKNWNTYSTESLDLFSNNVYHLVNCHHSILPEKSQQFAYYMIKNNILFHYGNLEGIEKVLYGMSRRASFVSNMEFAINDLKEHFDLFEKEFELFFPELKNYVQNEIDKGILI
jgi:acyl carrier protein phosphodiesterase